MIKVTRTFIIFTAICQILIYLLVTSKPFGMENSLYDILLTWLHMYTIATYMPLYLIISIMFLRNLYKSIRYKNMDYIYLLSVDVLLPYISSYYYNLFFANVLI